MNIGDIVRFQEEHFFNGAIQLGWVRQQPDLAAEVAGAFVFHGPRYHGSAENDQREFRTSYRLKDTATFLLDLLRAINAANDGQDINPFWLAIAGYGAGKSHLSVTLAELLSAPTGAIANQILTHLEQADAAIAGEARALLGGLDRPLLVLPVDGSSRFHLGNMLSQTVFAQLERAGVDATLIRALSPRFQTAEHFVERNYAFRPEAFAESLPDHRIDSICAALRNQDEDIFDSVNGIYMEANGHPIPIEGQESAQALLETLATQYCGEEGPFSHVLVLFDELGLYLEHAAEHPERAGARALQEIFQGVQDNAACIHFAGFIQYELKSYLQRFGSSDLRHLQRYLTRFDAADKCYLSSNLETLFAHMIQKDESALDTLWRQAHADQQLHQTWQRLSLSLPGFTNTPTWGDETSFNRVIARGCWPLHPMAVWLLTRQSDLIQQRSALAFVKEITTNHSQTDALIEGNLRQVSAADLLHDFLLEQYAAADQAPGGLIETLLQLLDQRAALLDRTMRLVMSGVAVLDKTRVGQQPRETANILLAEATALPVGTVNDGLEALSNLGLLEWNSDLQQYELLSDGASRGQFQHWLRIQRQAITGADIRQLFIRRGINDCELANPVETDFGKTHEISTSDWRFEAGTAHSGTIAQAIKLAVDEWPSAVLPDVPKGRVIYLYLDDRDDPLEVDHAIQDAFATALKSAKNEAAPVWVIGLQDSQNLMAEALARLLIIEERAGEADRERFRRFIDGELEAARNTLRSASDDAIRERRYWVAGMAAPPAQRLLKAGGEIFARLYSKASPFPFDGFATARGNGPKNVAELGRAMITQQVNQVWVQAQPSQLRNRIFAVLRDSWQALNSNLEPREPQATQLRSLYSSLEQDHQTNPERSLLVAFHWLTAPPRGMNAASATLLLSLLIGLRAPQRQLFLNGEAVSNADWVERAIPNKGRYLDEKVLAKTTIRFFDEDSEARWIHLLNAWDSETRLDEIIGRGNEAARQRKIEPVPPSLVERLLRLENITQEANAQFLEMRNHLENWERQLEKAIRKSSIHHCLEVGYQLSKAREKLLNAERWPADMGMECGKLIAIANEAIQREWADRWVHRQTVHNVAETNHFRERTEKEARWLAALGYASEAEQLERQAQHAILQVEARQRHALTLAEAEDYPRQPPPRGGEPILTLRDELKKGQNIIDSIRSIGSLSTAEKDAHVTAIERRIAQIRATIQNQEAQLGAIDTLSIKTEDDLRETIAMVERLRTLFSGDRNEVAINELARQLARIRQDLANWEQGDLPAERLDVLLGEQTARQLESFQHFLSAEEMDPPPWDLQRLYGSLVEERLALARQRSSEWLRPRLLLESEIPTLDIDPARQLKAELAAAPAYLAEPERSILERLLGAVDAQLHALEAEAHKAQLESWQAGFPDMKVIATLERAQIDTLLAELQSPPMVLGHTEQQWRDKLTEQLTARLDVISLDDLVSRIERLPPALRARLLERLNATG